MSFWFCRRVVWAGCSLARHGVLGEASLPWRQKRSPYRVFLAEMLLVRTRADIVARIYEDVFSHYPDIYKLADANESNLKFVLYPLGLSKRIPYIIKAARYICENFAGEVPSDVAALLQVPGIGLYTASAIAAFAYKQPLVPSDVNIFRFVGRVVGLEMENKTKGSKQLAALAPFLSEELTGLPIEKLLDFTRLICRPRKPLCERCCLTRFCKYFNSWQNET